MRRPLDGIRVLVTRPRQAGDPLRVQLAELGAEVVDVPMIEIRPLPYSDRVESALAKLDRTETVIFTSANAVRFFFELLAQSGRDASALTGCWVCAVGPSTARAIGNHGVHPTLVADRYTADDLGATLSTWPLSGTRVLIPRVRIARDALPALLTGLGASVEILPLYETVCPDEALDRLVEVFGGRGVDLVTFTSSSSVTNFVRTVALGGLAVRLSEQHPKIACLGPVTAETARRHGLRIDIMPAEYTIPALLDTIVRTYFQFRL